MAENINKSNNDEILKNAKAILEEAVLKKSLEPLTEFINKLVTSIEDERTYADALDTLKYMFMKIPAFQESSISPLYDLLNKYPEKSDEFYETLLPEYNTQAVSIIKEFLSVFQGSLYNFLDKTFNSDVMPEAPNPYGKYDILRMALKEEYKQTPKSAREEAFYSEIKERVENHKGDLSFLVSDDKANDKEIDSIIKSATKRNRRAKGPLKDQIMFEDATKFRSKDELKEWYKATQTSDKAQPIDKELARSKLELLESMPEENLVTEDKIKLHQVDKEEPFIKGSYKYYLVPKEAYNKYIFKDLAFDDDDEDTSEIDRKGATILPYADGEDFMEVFVENFTSSFNAGYSSNIDHMIKNLQNSIFEGEPDLKSDIFDQVNMVVNTKFQDDVENFFAALNNSDKMQEVKRGRQKTKINKFISELPKGITLDADEGIAETQAEEYLKSSFANVEGLLKEYQELGGDTEDFNKYFKYYNLLQKLPIKNKYQNLLQALDKGGTIDKYLETELNKNLIHAKFTPQQFLKDEDTSKKEVLDGENSVYTRLQHGISNYAELQKIKNKDYNKENDKNLNNYNQLLSALDFLPELVKANLFSFQQADKLLQKDSTSFIDAINSAKVIFSKRKREKEDEKYLSDKKKEMDNLRRTITYDTMGNLGGKIDEIVAGPNSIAKEKLEGTQEYRRLSNLKVLIDHVQKQTNEDNKKYERYVIEGILSGRYRTAAQADRGFLDAQMKEASLQNRQQRAEYRFGTIEKSLSALKADGQTKKQIEEIRKELKEAFNHEDIEKTANALDKVELKISKLNSKLQETKQRENEIEQAGKRVKDAFRTIATVLNNVANIITRTIVNAVKKAISYAKSFFKVFENGIKIIKRLIQLFGNLSNRVKHSKNSSNLLGGGWTELNSKISMLERAYNLITNNRFVSSASAVYSSIASLTVISGAAADSVVTFAESLENKLGASADKVLQSISELSTTIYGLGIKADQISSVSENLVMMGQSFARLGIMGGDYDVIIGKITSGLRGMTASIDDLGVSVREVTQKELLKRIKESPEDFNLNADEIENLTDTYQNLTEEQRVVLRTYSILEQYQKKYGDSIGLMQKYMNTAIGKMNNLKEAAFGLVSTIGKSLFVVFSTIAPYIEWIIRKLDTLIQTFTSKLGIFKSNEAAVKEYKEALGKTTEEVKENTEAEKDNNETKDNNSLLSFDKITTLSNSADASEKIDLSGMLDGLTDLQSQLDNIKESYSTMLDEKIKALKDKIQIWVDCLMGKHIDLSFGFRKDESVDDAKQILNNLWETAKNIRDTLLYVFIGIADDAKLGGLLSDTIGLFKDITGAVKEFSEAVEEGVKQLYNNHSNGVQEWGEKVKTKIGEARQAVQDLTTFTKDNSYLISASIGGNATAKEMLSLNWETFIKGHETIGKIYDVIAQIYEILKEAWGVVDAIITKIINPQLTGTGSFIKDILLPFIVTQLQWIRQFIERNADTINEIVDALQKLAWDIIKTAVEVIKTALQLIVDNKELILTVLRAISGILNWIGNNPDVLVKLLNLVIALKAVKFTAGIFKTVGDLGFALKGISEGYTILKGFNKLSFSGLKTNLLKAFTPVTNIFKKLFNKEIVVTVAQQVGQPTQIAMNGAAKASAVGLATVNVASWAGVITGTLRTISDFHNALKATDEEVRAKYLKTGAFKGTALAAGAAIGFAIGGPFGALIGGGIGGFLSLIPENIQVLVADFTIKLTTETIPTILGKIDGVVSNLQNSVIKFFETVFPKATEFMQTAITNVKNFIDGLPDPIKEALSNAWNTLVNPFGNLIKAIGSFLDSVLPNKVTEKLSSLWDKVTGNYNNGKARTTNKNMPKYGDGGLITEHQIAEIGEDGLEVVIPLTSDKRERGLQLWRQAASYLGLGDLQGRMSKITSIKSIPNLAAYSNGGTFKNGQLTINSENIIKLLGDFDNPIATTGNSEDMQQNLYLAVYNALAKFVGDNPGLFSTSSGAQSLNITGPLFFKDKTAMMTFAKMLMPYLKMTNKVDSNLDYRMT